MRDSVLAEPMLKLNKDLPKAKTPHEQESLQRQIAATDEQIDSLVHELYGLTEEEIRVFEENQNRDMAAGRKQGNVPSPHPWELQTLAG